MKYLLEIEFSGEKFCLGCPMRDFTDDCCKMQLDENGDLIDFEDWGSQLKGCPLKPTD